MEKHILPKFILLITVIAVTVCNYSISYALSNTSVSNQTWSNLLINSSLRLETLLNESSDPMEGAWFELALLSKQKNLTPSALAQQLMDWRAQYPTHPANKLFPSDKILTQLQHQSTPQNIAILLPLHGVLAESGKKIRAGFLNAYYQHMTEHPLAIKFYDTSGSNDIYTLYRHAVADGADFVIGPLSKPEVQQLGDIKPLGIPVLALNYTTAKPFQIISSNFYQFGLLPEDEINQLVQRAKQNGLKRAIIIAPANAWGRRMAAAVSKQWRPPNNEIRSSLFYSTKTNLNKQIANLLQTTVVPQTSLQNQDLAETKRRDDFDVIFLFATNKEARTIVPLLHFYNAGDIPIFASSTVLDDKYSIHEKDLNGITICDIPNNIHSPAKSNAVNSDRLYALGQDAYLLSQSMQRLNFLTNFPLYASTGSLSLSSNQQIHRHIPCTVVQNDFT